MEAARLLCLCVCVFAGLVHAQVGSICRPNERFLMCGDCQKTCLDPVPDCKGLCKTGCYCEGDEVRNSTGHCVKLSDCPPLPAAYKLETSEPRPLANCSENEEYRFCEPCNRTCDNPNPICPAQCSRGCFCRDELVRDRDGRCVQQENCSNHLNEIPHHPYTEKTVAYDEPTCGANQVYKDCENCEKTCSNPNPPCPAQCSRGCFCKDGFYKNSNGECVRLDSCSNASHPENPIVYQLTCGTNQVYKLCETCEKTCSNPNPMCPAQCNRGCFCKDGLVKAPSGECVTLNSCPKAEVFMGPSDLSVEDCDENEEYFSCGWCEPSCSQLAPMCPEGACVRGCQCKPPLVRHRSGLCVDPEDCNSRKCKDPNEEFVCRYGCEPRCDRRPCETRVRRCHLGCHCRLGLLRDSSGRCVEPERCKDSSPHQTQ